ncbi:hypothetical protein Tco_1499617 [Tanacetum coccineum]
MVQGRESCGFKMSVKEQSANNKEDQYRETMQIDLGYGASNWMKNSSLYLAGEQNTIKEHFVGVQTALYKEVKEMEEIFDQMNNEVDKNTEAPDFNSFFKIKNLEHQIQEKDNVIRNLKVLVANVNDRSCEPYNAKDVTALIEQNDCVRIELEKVKQHYKELYDSIKITRAHTSEKTSTMLNEIESLKAQLRSKEPCFTSDYVKPKVLAPGMEIVEEARVVKPLDNSLNYACQYTKLSQELLEYVIGTCPKSFGERDNKAPSTPVTRKKQVTFSDKPGTSSSNTQKHKVHQRVQQTNIPVIPSTGVNDSTEASGSKPRSNTKKNRILPAKKENKKEVEVRLRTNKSVWTKVNRVDSSSISIYKAAVSQLLVTPRFESLNITRHNKTPTYDLVQDKKPDLTFSFRVFIVLYGYPTNNDSENIRKISSQSRHWDFRWKSIAVSLKDRRTGRILPLYRLKEGFLWAKKQHQGRASRPTFDNLPFACVLRYQAKPTQKALKLSKRGSIRTIEREPLAWDPLVSKRQRQFTNSLSECGSLRMTRFKKEKVGKCLVFFEDRLVLDGHPKKQRSTAIINYKGHEYRTPCLDVVHEILGCDPIPKTMGF